MEMRGCGRPIDAITLRAVLQDKGAIEGVGGAAYMLDLQGTGISSNAVSYAERIRSLSKLRGIIRLGTEMVAIGYDGEAEHIDSTLAEVMSMTTALTLTHQTSSVPVSTVLCEVMNNLKSGVKNYFTPPSVPLARFREGDLVIIGAGTSAGKTAVTLDWADGWSKDKQVVYFEYEMPETDLISRLVCKHAGVEMRQIQDGDLTQEEIARIEDASEMLQSRKLKVQEVWCNANTLFAKIRREAQQGAEIVIVDHLGLIPYGKVQENDAKAIGKYVTNPMKRLASELGITIILLVQLNREGQRDGFPKLYHLRDSGEIEQDGSVVLMLWSEKSIRDDWGSRVKVREQSNIVAEEELMDDSFYAVRIGVEKNRNGQLGEAWAKFYGANFRYVYPEDQARDLIVERPLFGEGD
jgi:replicative DNA helicase